MAPYLQRSRPVISSRIEFKTLPPPPLPTIRTRIEFTAERLAGMNRGVGEGEGGNQAGRRPTIGDLGAKGSVNEQVTQPTSNPPRVDAIRALPLAQKTTKIPKPAGEPGRPGSGGFCVDDTLVKSHGWSKQAVEELISAIRSAARKSLDTTVSFRSQNPNAIQKICDAMMEESRWPILRTYDDCWPVRSILKLTLKSSAEASRRMAIKFTAERVRTALAGAQ